ncbi:hypothetical protein BC826DRAFT_1049714 [Russula brevipes]|nr:hypothetical protein BC826DRAFT_1049714 [Russula brevipes]
MTHFGLASPCPCLLLLVAVSLESFVPYLMPLFFLTLTRRLVSYKKKGQIEPEITVLFNTLYIPLHVKEQSILVHSISTSLDLSRVHCHLVVSPVP